MAELRSYKKKRSLDKTPEPKARLKKVSKQQLIFVVQKHQARHLHYDLRFELDGVLKSWAVPKGPPQSEHDKRLAVMVEDHPYDYKDFEGTIPAGNYGAGTVEIWDSGTYTLPGVSTFAEAEAYMRAGLKKGQVHIIMHGKRLSGDFILIKTPRPGSENGWLWFKKVHKDDSKKESKKKVDPFPKNITPMLATLSDKAFNKKDWIFEIKWDGYRALGIKKGDRVELISRNQKSFNNLFPLIVSELKKHLKHDVILDGEVVALDKHGMADFQRLQDYKDIQDKNLFYYVFDVLYWQGEDVRNRPLIERKELLETIIAPLKNLHVRYNDHVHEKGVEFFREAKKQGIEGIIAKNAQSTYQTARSSDWVKIKISMRQEMVIGGFTSPRGNRSELGALLLGFYKGDEFIYAGCVGTGFTEQTLKTLSKALRPLIQTSNPFSTNPKTNAKATFVKPKLVCEVSFAEWTRDNQLRQAVFHGLRVDKKAGDVVREIEASSFPL